MLKGAEMCRLHAMATMSQPRYAVNMTCLLCCTYAAAKSPAEHTGKIHELCMHTKGLQCTNSTKLPCSCQCVCDMFLLGGKYHRSCSQGGRSFPGRLLGGLVVVVLATIWCCVLSPAVRDRGCCACSRSCCWCCCWCCLLWLSCWPLLGHELGN